MATDYPNVRGVWLYGPPGSGKTTRARTAYGSDVYFKAQNKWWDGFRGQLIVVLDDLDSTCLGHYLKIWADKWGAYGEIKGGTVALNYQRFIVTSNFSIEELFAGNDPASAKLRAALLRRFEQIECLPDPEDEGNPQ